MTASVSIRPATAADAPAFAELNVMADEGLPLVHWAKTAPDGYAPLDHGAALAALPHTPTGFTNTDLAEQSGAVVGAACSYAIGPQPLSEDFMAPFRNLKSQFAGAWYLDFIAVRPRARGQGIASLLLDAAAGRAARAGCDTLFLLMLDTNRTARRAYLRAGFTEAARAALPDHRPWPPPEAREVIAYARAATA